MALLPLIPFIAAYVILDPYKVLREYDDYFSDGLGVNKGVVTLHSFNAYNDSLQYNSFIIGSSLTCYFEISEWKKYLPEGAVPFHFDSSGQIVPVTRMFLEYLDASCDSISNVLIVLNSYILKSKYNYDYLPCLIPPRIKPGLKYLLSFHYKYFRKISTYNYYSAYVPWYLSGKKEDLTNQHIFEPQPIVYNPIINEESIPEWNRMIETDSAAFYAGHPAKIQADTCSYKILDNIITPALKKEFRMISDIIKKRSVNACIIITPNPALEVLSDEDNRFMSETFGDSYVNLDREFRAEMSDRKNFYDNIHFRPPLSAKYLKRSYTIIDSRRNN